MEEISLLYRNIKHHFKPLQDLLGVPFLLGGGCIGDFISFGRVIKDYDFFFKSYEDMKNFEKRIKDLGFRLIGESEMGRQYSFLNLEFDIIAWQVKEKASDWVKQSDFTVNCAILEGNELFMHERTLQDCLNKELVPIFVDTLFRYRIKRYIDKGYHIHPGSALNNVLFNQEFDLDSVKKCEDSEVISINLEYF